MAISSFYFKKGFTPLALSVAGTISSYGFGFLVGIPTELILFTRVNFYKTFDVVIVPLYSISKG